MQLPETAAGVFSLCPVRVPTLTPTSNSLIISALRAHAAVLDRGLLMRLPFCCRVCDAVSLLVPFVCRCFAWLCAQRCHLSVAS
jgi:hypothetical protein